MSATPTTLGNQTKTYCGLFVRDADVNKVQEIYGKSTLGSLELTLIATTSLSEFLGSKASTTKTALTFSAYSAKFLRQHAQIKLIDKDNNTITATAKGSDLGSVNLFNSKGNPKRPDTIGKQLSALADAYAQKLQEEQAANEKALEELEAFIPVDDLTPPSSPHVENPDLLAFFDPTTTPPSTLSDPSSPSTFPLPDPFSTEAFSVPPLQQLSLLPNTAGRLQDDPTVIDTSPFSSSFSSSPQPEVGGDQSSEDDHKDVSGSTRNQLPLTADELEEDAASRTLVAHHPSSPPKTTPKPPSQTNGTNKGSQSGSESSSDSTTTSGSDEDSSSESKEVKGSEGQESGASTRRRNSDPGSTQPRQTRSLSPTKSKNEETSSSSDSSSDEDSRIGANPSPSSSPKPSDNRPPVSPSDPRSGGSAPKPSGASSSSSSSSSSGEPAGPGKTTYALRFLSLVALGGGLFLAGRAAYINRAAIQAWSPWLQSSPAA